MKTRLTLPPSVSLASLLLVLLAGPGGAATPPSESLTVGLMAHWSLDDGVSDLNSMLAKDAVSGVDATLNTADPSVAWLGTAESRFGGAIQVDGAATYLAVPASEFLDPRTNQVSLSLWVKLSTLPSQMGAGFGGIYDSAQDAYVLYLDRGNRELRFKITDASGAAARPGIPEDRLVVGEWLHIAAVYDGGAGETAGEARLYLNGEVVDVHVGADGAGGNGLTGIVRAGQIAAMGRDGGVAQYFLGSVLDDVGLWRRALSEEEIQYLASGNVIPNPVPPPDPLVIVTQPNPVTVLAGSLVSFQVGISNAIPPVSYQWRRNNSDLLGATQARLSLVASAETAGQYSVVVTDSRGSLESTSALLTVVPLASEPAASLVQGLIALWTLDDGVAQADSVRVTDRVNANQGSLVAVDPTMSWITGEEARFGGALRVFGADSSVTIPASDSLNFSADQVTVAGWVKLTALPSEMPEAFGGIFDSVQDNYVLYLDRSNRELRFKVTDAAGQAARPGIPEAALVLGEWIHVAGVYNARASEAAGEAVVYLNGQAIDRHLGNDGSGGNGLKGFVRTGQQAGMGRNGTEARYYLNAALDDIAVWSRALSEPELAYLAAGNAVPSGLPEQPILLGTPSIQGNDLVLGWSGGRAPYRVQKRASLSEGAWEEVASTPTSTATFPRTGSAAFYRVLGAETPAAARR